MDKTHQDNLLSHYIILKQDCKVIL